MPDTVEPLEYRARIVLSDGPVTDKLDFFGTIEIVGEIAQSTSLIWLDGVDLDVSEAHATQGTDVVSLQATPLRVDGRIGLRAPKPLSKGSWTITIAYSGHVRDVESDPAPPLVVDQRLYADRPSTGLFRRVIGDATYWFTQSEPIYARQIFPCIDEPEHKVPWRLTLDVPRGDVALANAPVVRVSDINSKYQRFEFARTEPLPSYLVAFAVGRFDIIDAGSTKSGVRIRAVVPRGSGVSSEVIVRTSSRIVSLIEDYLGIPYPYAKLDIVAVPRLNLAMENAGLITIDSKLLADAQTCIAFIEHELAHQWFGDYVTPNWWNDLWLSENLTAWMASKIQLDPDQVGAAPELLPRESLSRRPSLRTNFDDSITLEANNFESQIDRWSGGPVIGMMEQFIGPKLFRDAVHAYLVAHHNATATGEDFFQAIADVAGTADTAALRGLLERPGLPAIDVRTSCSHGRETTIITRSPDDWPSPTPLCYSYDDSGKRADDCIVVNATITRLPPRAQCTSWLMPDPDGKALAVVSIDTNTLEVVVANGWSSLSSEEQRRALERTRDNSQLRISISLRLLESKDILAAGTGAAQIQSIVASIPETLRTELQRWIRAHAGAWDVPRVEDVYPTQVGSLLGLLAWAGDTNVQIEARKLFAQYQELPEVSRETVLAILADEPETQHELLMNVGTMSSEELAELGEALKHVHDPLSLVDREYEALQQIEARSGQSLLGQLIVSRCDQSKHEKQDRLLKRWSVDAGWALQQMQECAAQQARLTPTIRAWLNRQKIAGF